MAVCIYSQSEHRGKTPYVKKAAIGEGSDELQLTNIFIVVR